VVGKFIVPYARREIEEEIQKGNIKPEKVRGYVWYDRWKKVGMTLPADGREDVLVLMFKLIDEVHGFGTESNAFAALKALHVLVKDMKA